MGSTTEAWSISAAAGKYLLLEASLEHVADVQLCAESEAFFLCWIPLPIQCSKHSTQVSFCRCNGVLVRILGDLVEQICPSEIEAAGNISGIGQPWLIHYLGPQKMDHLFMITLWPMLPQIIQHDIMIEWWLMLSMQHTRIVLQHTRIVLQQKSIS